MQHAHCRCRRVCSVGLWGLTCAWHSSVTGLGGGVGGASKTSALGLGGDGVGAGLGSGAARHIACRPGAPRAGAVNCMGMKVRCWSGTRLLA